jgi:hypothetical protein
MKILAIDLGLLDDRLTLRGLNLEDLFAEPR